MKLILKALMYRGMLLLAVLLMGMLALAACGEEVEEPEIEEEGELGELEIED